MSLGHYYSVGDPLLDAQHKQIIGIINELYDAMQKGKDRVALKPISEHCSNTRWLTSRTKNKSCKSMSIPTGCSIRRCTIKSDSEHATCKSTPTSSRGMNILRFLKEWWVGHIQGLDKKYTPYLELAGSHR